MKPPLQQKSHIRTSTVLSQFDPHEHFTTLKLNTPEVVPLATRRWLTERCRKASGIWISQTFSKFAKCYVAISALLQQHAAYSRNSLPTFRDNLSVPSSKDKQSNYSWSSWTLNIAPIGCLETSKQNKDSTLHYNPEERRSHLRCGLSLNSGVLGCVYTHWWRVPWGWQL